jgi:hypothetical protein
MAYLHLVIPITFTIIVTVVGFSHEEREFFPVVVGSLFFYCAPYLCWAMFQFLAKPKVAVVHAGYIGATLSLLLISSVWLLPPDQSGLPIQWMAYWPLAGILAVLLSGVTYFASKSRSS